MYIHIYIYIIRQTAKEGIAGPGDRRAMDEWAGQFHRRSSDQVVVCVPSQVCPGGGVSFSTLSMGRLS